MRRAADESHRVNAADQVQMLAQTGRCCAMRPRWRSATVSTTRSTR
jgi:hypothetical protein